MLATSLAAPPRHTTRLFVTKQSRSSSGTIFSSPTRLRSSLVPSSDAGSGIVVNEHPCFASQCELLRRDVADAYPSRPRRRGYDSSVSSVAEYVRRTSSGTIEGKRESGCIREVQEVETKIFRTRGGEFPSRSGTNRKKRRLTSMYHTRNIRMP